MAAQKCSEDKKLSPHGCKQCSESHKHQGGQCLLHGKGTPPTTTLLPPTLQGPIAASLSSKGFHGMWNLLLAKCRREKHLEIASSENYVTNAALVRNNACWHSLNMLQIIYRSQQNSFRVPGPESELVCFMLVKTFSLNKIQSLGTAWAFQTAFSP